MDFEGVINRVHQVLSGLSHTQIYGLALLGMILVGIPDYLFGIEVSLSVFYLFPVVIATWYANRSAGILVACCSALIGLADDFAAGHLLTRPALIVWNGSLHLGFMLIIIYLLSTLQAHIESEQELARSDAATGIANRRAFLERLQYCIDLAGRAKGSVTLAYIDLDNFKKINDQRGHEEGDKVLKLVASVLAQTIRRTDLAARLGGDEFAMLILDTNRENAESLINKTRQALLQALSKEYEIVTCSIGCVTFNDPPVSAEAAIKAADSVMYRVKHQGKNAVIFENASSS